MFRSMGGAASDSQPPTLLNNGQFSGTLSFGENTSIFCHGPYGGPPVNIPDNGGVNDYRNDNNDGLNDPGPFVHMFSTIVKIANEPIPSNLTVRVTINSMASNMRIVNWNDNTFFNSNNTNILSTTNSAPAGGGTALSMGTYYSLAQRRDDNAWASTSTPPLTYPSFNGPFNNGWNFSNTANSGTIDITSFVPVANFGVSDSAYGGAGNNANYVTAVFNHVSNTNNHTQAGLQFFIYAKSRSFPFTGSYNISCAYV